MFGRNLRSRPTEHILDEVQRLVDNGYREIVLTGIHLGHYGVDFEPRAAESRLAAAFASGRSTRRLDGDFRIRLSSIEAHRSHARTDRV